MRLIIILQKEKQIIYVKDTSTGTDGITGEETSVKTDITIDVVLPQLSDRPILPIPDRSIPPNTRVFAVWLNYDGFAYEVLMHSRHYNHFNNLFFYLV